MKNKYKTDPIYHNKQREYVKKAAMKYRAKKQQVLENYTTEDRLYTYQLFNHKCALCDSTIQLQIDHWLPLSKGNPLTRTNAVLLCKKCNSKKSWKLPTDCYNTETIKKIENIIHNHESR